MNARPVNLAWLMLGSNIDPERNLALAVESLRRYGRIDRVSRVWQTRPTECPEQPDILNAAVLLKTHLSADELHGKAIKAIERQQGRQRDPANRHAPRTIDIDIVFFNCSTFILGRREIPDPDTLRHAWLAVLLAELDPDFRHPTNGLTLAAIASQFDLHESGLKRRDDVQLSVG